MAQQYPPYLVNQALQSPPLVLAGKVHKCIPAGRVPDFIGAAVQSGSCTQERLKQVRGAKASAARAA